MVFLLVPQEKMRLFPLQNSWLSVRTQLFARLRPRLHGGRWRRSAPPGVRRVVPKGFKRTAVSNAGRNKQYLS